MKIVFIYPSFERHADSHPELRAVVPCNEYLGPPSMGIASVAATTPPGHEIVYVDDRVTVFNPDMEADLFALSFFTPAATRALEIGDALLARGRKVVMGGIFPTQMPQEASKHCTSVVVGEGEGVWPAVVQDAERDDLKPFYRAGPLADLGSFPPPRLDLYLNAETDTHKPDDYPLQFTRGCPLRCDACVLPSVMGRELRFQSEDNLRAIMTRLARAGKLISFTEDTSVMAMQGVRRRFREFLALCVRMQAEGTPLRFSYLGISMPMILHLDTDLLLQLRETGIDRFYLVGGFDRITRDAFGKGDAKAEAQAHEAIRRCHDHGIDPYVSFLAGNRDDDAGVFDRMLDFADESGVELAEFCISTPYPGTPLWREYEQEGRIFDRTWKRYNDANCVFRPHHMSPDELTRGYLYLWREFYKTRRADIVSREEHARRTIQF
ncbi:MAG: Anaerobic magnesium-protoporphyrin IX monomethyl ester cyclase [Myxococcota bacterium]|nr:Anaerobic magnesium-protoporphyrin IX monomethyl ester cyclase [Myxococcota bacterium]